jgi:2-polyprenyl-3-methyl-5-hydroxy-6-metoxy-1,4-benzoquinol methylase
MPTRVTTRRGSIQTINNKWTNRDISPLVPRQRILEVGCGSGGLLKLLQATNELVGVDASEDGIGACLSRDIEGIEWILRVNRCRLPTSLLT